MVYVQSPVNVSKASSEHSCHTIWIRRKDPLLKPWKEAKPSRSASFVLSVWVVCPDLVGCEGGKEREQEGPACSSLGGPAAHWPAEPGEERRSGREHQGCSGRWQQGPLALLAVLSLCHRHCVSLHGCHLLSSGCRENVTKEVPRGLQLEWHERSCVLDLVGAPRSFFFKVH